MGKSPDKHKRPSRRRVGGKPVPPKEPDDELLSFTPLTLLATILKCTLKEKITDQECDRVCRAYLTAVQIIFDDEDEE